MPVNRDGALASQHIKKLIAQGAIAMTQEPDADQIQPASLDLRLGSVAYRVRSSFLPGKDRTVTDCLDSMTMHSVDLTQGSVLEKSCVYIVPLQESLKLPEHLSAAGNPKSSTGRLDVFTRLITDYGVEFEQVPAGYEGPLYAEIQGQDVAGSYRIFASQVESGELSNPEIAARINRMANGEDQIASGLSKIKVSAYFWFIGVVAIALLQVLLIRHLLATHNKLNQPGTPQSGAPV